MTFRTLLITLLAALALTAAAQDHPLEAPGFVPNKTFDFHDIDSVNTFNGNLIVRIPIGQPFHVNGGLSYGLALHYNSKIWRWWAQDIPGGDCGPAPSWWQCGLTIAEPYKHANAAFGWSLSLGRLFVPGDPWDTASDSWEHDPPLNEYLYEDPDGATHEVSENGSPGVARDGSFFRLRVSGSTAYVDSPDGVIREFQGGTTNGWWLTKISDASGNVINVSYNTDHSIWTITDTDRTIKVYFGAGDGYLLSVLQKVEIPSPRGGGIETYTFHTKPWAFPLPVGVSNPVTSNGDPVMNTVTALTAVERPAGGNFTFTTDGSLDGTPAYSTTPAISGALLHMQLPTGGQYDWGYGEGRPYGTVRKLHSPGLERPLEIRSRAITDPFVTDVNNRTSTWRYTYGPGFLQWCYNKSVPRERVTTVTRPDGAKEVSHHQFYTGVESNDCAATDTFDTSQFSATSLTWLPNDYGLPFTRGVGGGAPGSSTLLHTIRHDPDPNYASDATRDLFLSYELYDNTGHRVLSRYVTYTSDTLNGWELRVNPRVLATATFYDDASCTTANCPAPSNFSLVHNYDYRNFGNYACSVSSALDYDATTTRRRTTCRDFPSTLGVNDAWAFGSPNGECTVAGDIHTYDTCLSTTGSFNTLFDYDRSLNRLRAKRVLKGNSLNAADLLTTYTYGDDPLSVGKTNGNVTSIAYAGGDCPDDGTAQSNCANLSTTTTFPTATPRYTINHTYSYTSGAPNRVTSKYAGFNFVIGDFVLEPVSGTITESHDSSGLVTKYRYDAIGRLSDTTSPDGTTASYNYRDGQSPVTIDVTTSTLAGESVHNSYDYDGLGRLWHERMKVNGQDSTRTTRYDLMQRPWRTSAFRIDVPICDASDSTCTETTYDALGKTVTSKGLDHVTTTYTYSNPWQTTRTTPLDGSNTSVTVEKVDAFGRLVKVTDPVSTVGTYTYDDVDHLVTAVVSDTASHSQTRTFTYDHRGFLSSETHPENGTTSYTYDVRGHVLTKNLATTDIFDLRYHYDNAERVLDVQSRAALNSSSFHAMKEFAYEDSTSAATFHNLTDYILGKPKTALRHNYQALDPSSPSTITDVKVLETYHYTDPAGRLSDRLTDVYADSTLKQSFAQTTTYNGLGLPQKSTYPDCTGATGLPSCGRNASWGSIVRTYEEGRPLNISGIAGMIYAGNGMLTTIAHTNGVIDTITPDSTGLPRPSSIKFEGAETTCDAPSITVSPVSQHITSGGSATFIVQATGTGPLSVQWYDAATNTAITTNATDWTYTTPALSQTTTYYAKVSNSCSSTVAQSSTVSATVDTCVVPAIVSVSPDVTVPYMQAPTLTASAKGDNVVYEWYQEGDSQLLQSSTDPTFKAGDVGNLGRLTRTLQFKVRAVNTCGASSYSSLITVHVIPPAPSAVKATPGTSSITLNWTLSPSNDVAYQRIETMTSAGQWLWANDVDSTVHTYAFSVTPPANGKQAVAYRIKVVTSDSLASSYSNVTVGVVPAFTLPGAGTAITATPLTEMLKAINAVRAIGATGLSDLTWTGILPSGVSAPAAGGVLSAAHVSALRSSMDAALAAIGVVPPSYTDAGLPDETLPRYVHITELWSRVQ